MASIPDNYEINISKNGKHWCRVELPDSFTEQAEEKLNFLRELFGDEYHISMIRWECKGEYKKGEWR